MTEMGQIKLVVNDPHSWQALEAYFKLKQQAVAIQLATTTGLEEMYKLQGEYRSLGKLLTLREEINKRDRK